MSDRSGSTGAVLAIDAGNSKTDALLVFPDGTVAARAGGPGFQPQRVGLVTALTSLDGVVARLLPDGGTVEHVAAYLAGADLPVEEQALADALAARRWGRTVRVGNDTFALLRAGSSRQWGVAVVCGAGINCVGVGPDGQVARFPALGAVSGDWGGGLCLADEVLWWAARGDDGRGPATALTTAVPAHFGLTSMRAAIEAVHLGQVPAEVRRDLAPLLFAVAAAGDPVAGALVDRLAEEVVTMAAVVLRRLDLLARPVDVILGGGVLTAGHPRLMTGISAGLADRAPHAVPVVTDLPPVAGAALLGLDEIGADPAAEPRLRAALAAGNPSAGRGGDHVGRGDISPRTAGPGPRGG